MNYDLTTLRKGCESLGIELSEQQEQQFLQYYEMLIERNKVVNLTSITEFEEVLVKHFVDSLAVTKAIKIEEIKSLIDVGTGGGFPGIPLNIAFPSVKSCLLDSLQKRIVFLEDVIRVLKLKDIQAVHGRAEIAAKEKVHREQYDLCVSRAVANLASLSEYCLPFVKIGGAFVSYKSGKVQEEMEQAKKAIQVLGGEIENVEYFTIPGTDMERSLVVIRKKKATPKKYPRKAGTPTKEPIA